MVSREDVAALAGVSVATVSHVLNSTKYVSPELQSRVRAAVEKLNYVPNRVARSLVTKRTEQVGIIVPSFGNPHHGAIADGMEEIARKNGYTVALFCAEGPADHYIASIIERQLDGLFIATTAFRFSAEELQRMVAHGVTLVTPARLLDKDGRAVQLEYSSITVDFRSAYRTLFGYLADLGHRRVAFLAGLPEHPTEERCRCYRDNVRDFGLDSDDELIVYGVYPYLTMVQDGYTAMKSLLSRETRVTAIVAVNDLMAIGALKALREAGVRVPSDVSVVGCDDIVLSEIATPALTTLEFRQREYGRMAMELLLRGMSGQPPVTVSFDVRLVIRESTGKVNESWWTRRCPETETSDSEVRAGRVLPDHI